MEGIDKQRIMGAKFWTDEFYIATVGKRAYWTAVERYIQRRGKTKEKLKQLELLSI